MYICFEIVVSGSNVLARIDSAFYHGVEINYTNDIVAVFFQESSPQFQKLYDKQNVNRVVKNIPVNVSQLKPDLRVIVETESGAAVLGTVVGEYLHENITFINRSTNNSDAGNNSTVKTISGKTELLNLTLRLDRNGKMVSVTQERIWLLPVQLSDKGDIIFVKVLNIERNYSRSL